MNYIEIFNEACILAASYHLFLFTNFVNNANLSYAIGWSLIGLTISNILVNIVIVFYFGYHQLKGSVMELKQIYF